MFRTPFSRRQQVEREAGLQSKWAELSRWEAELGARQRELEALREECRSLGGEVKGERGRVEELQRQLHAATTQQGVLQQHKEQLQQRLSQVRWHQWPGEVAMACYSATQEADVSRLLCQSVVSLQITLTLLHFPPQLSDYPYLKQKVSELGKQLQASEQRLAEVRAEHHQQSTEQLHLIKQLQRRLARPSTEHLALQASVEMHMGNQ